MADLYRHPQWAAFREEILEADGYICVECGRGQDEVVLQVHHKKYVPGKMPWEYSHNCCETLCRGCHARHHGKVPPSSGWHLFFQDDLEDMVGECELCGTTLRYQFHVHHPNWQPMLVGTDCCDRLTGTVTASEIQDRMEKRSGRKKRYLKSTKWKSHPLGIARKEYETLIIIRKFGPCYKIVMRGQQGKQEFESIERAKAHVFDLKENGQLKEFIDRKNEEYYREYGIFP